MRALLAGIVAITASGCVSLETYGDPELPERERAVVEGYWHYRLLYDEELHIAGVDGKRSDGLGGWPYAYAVSLPAGRHWLHLVLMRNSSDVARCAIELEFQALHRYELARLDTDQALLAHPASSPYRGSISLRVSGPSGSASQISVPAVCATTALCRQSSDCPTSLTCRVQAGLAFGSCERD